MPKYRPDIDEEKEAAIKYDVKKGTSINKTASIYGISFTLARQIVQGNRVKPASYPTKPPPSNEELCTCCNERPKKPGNRFLCSTCEREG